MKRKIVLANGIPSCKSERSEKTGHYQSYLKSNILIAEEKRLRRQAEDYFKVF